MKQLGMTVLAAVAGLGIGISGAHSVRAAGKTLVCPSGCPFSSVQAATNSTDPGGFVLVQAGTYTEQLTITKSLTIQGAGTPQTTVKAPASLVADAFGKLNVVDISGENVNVSMSNLTVSGPGPVGGSINTGIAVFAGATLNLSNAAILNIENSPFSGAQNGEGIRVGTPQRTSPDSIGHGKLNQVTVSGYQKNGITVAGVGSTATISQGTVTGAGSTSIIAQNGIEIASGAVGTVSAMTVSGNSYAPFPESVGILLFAPGPGMNVLQNNVFGNDYGIYLATTPGASVQGNRSTNNISEGIVLQSDSPNNTMSSNKATGNPQFDLEDDTTGAGTAGTANNWVGNACMKGLPQALCSR